MAAFKIPTLFELCKKCAKNRLEYIKIIIFIINKFIKIYIYKKQINAINVEISRLKIRLYYYYHIDVMLTKSYILLRLLHF